MIRRTGLCFLILVLAYTTSAIEVTTSYKIFHTSSDGGKTFKPYLEVYWQVDPNTINFNKNEKGHFVSSLVTELSISQKDKAPVSKKYLLQTTPAASIKAAHYQNILDLNRQMVEYGEVTVQLSMHEKGFPDKKFTYEEKIEIKKEDAPIQISNIQLLDTFYKAPNTQSVFQRNNSLQVPLCMDFLDDHRKFIHYYCELYNIAQSTKKKAILTTYVSKKPFDLALYSIYKSDTVSIAPIVPIKGSLNLERLPSGNYYLNIVLKDLEGTKLTQRNIFFQRSNMHPVIPPKDTTVKEELFEHVEVFDVSSTFVGKYNPAQLKAILKMLQPIATANELNSISGFLKTPEVTYVRYFIYNFWKSRAEDGNTDKAWDNFTKKVKEVNRMFGSKLKPGYETDRGFTYLKFGEPEQRYVVSSEQGALPYEVWQYNAPGRQSNSGAFLFYNPGFMVNDYRLLHSTVVGELRNTAWRSLLYPNGQVGNNLNSRAEQILQNK